jgi:hypothetical protein
MSQATPLEWSIRSDAAAGYFIFDLGMISILSGLNALYLSGPLAGQAAFNPPLPGAFIPSIAVPAGGYAALAPAAKGTYQV